MARFGYDMLPTWSHWQIERYLSLDDQQRAIVSRHIDDLHRWHRRVQLPVYVEFLGQVEERMRVAAPPAAAAQPDAALVSAWRGRIGEAWTPVAERLAPGLAELALTLRPEQIERLRKRLDDADVTYREKFLPDKAADRIQARGDRVVKRAEFFLGSLDGAQERELRQLAAALPATEETWLAERQHRNRTLLALLQRIAREKPAQAQAERLTREYLLGMWTPADARRRERIEAGIAASDALAVQMLARATPTQRSHLVRTLRGYADDFRSLAGTALAANR